MKLAKATVAGADEATRRHRLADWITASDNQYFATSYVNRIWGYLTGTGIRQAFEQIGNGDHQFPFFHF